MEDEINLLDYWRIIWKGKILIFLTTFIVTAASIVISLMMTKIYKAEAVIMPMGGQKGGGGIAAAVAQMGMGGLLGGVGASASNSTQILAILKSRTLKEKVIEKYNLMPFFFEDGWDSKLGRWKSVDPKEIPSMEEGVRRFTENVKFVEDKKGQTVSIRAETRIPEKSAVIVNGVVSELASHINANTFTEAKRNRIFVEGRLERNKADLLEAGKELASFYSTNRISNAVPMVDVDVTVGEGVRGHGLGVMGEQENPSPSTHHPLPDTDNLQKQADDLAEKIRQARVVHEVPQQVYLQYLTLRQELLGKMNALLTQQYEMAKIDEAKEDLNFQIIDKAVVPIRKYRPKRAQIVITTFVMSIFLSVFYLFFREYLRKVKYED